MARQTVIPSDDPVRRPATAAQVMPVLIRLGFSTGHEISRDRAVVLAQDIARAGWTEAEIDLAAALIPADRELMKEINFARTINSGVFMMAKDREEVARGRLFTHADMRRWCAEQQVTDEAFEVVRVEGDRAENGLLRPWWRLK